MEFVLQWLGPRSLTPTSAPVAPSHFLPSSNFQVCPPLISPLQPQALSNIIWAVATSQPPSAPSSSSTTTAAPLPPQPWVDAFLSAFSSRLPLMSDQATSNVVWSLARLRITMGPELASAVVQHMHALDERGGVGGGVSGQALANCLWGLAKPGILSLNQPAAEILEGMVRRRLQAEVQALAAGTGTSVSLRPAESKALPSAGTGTGTGFRPAEVSSLMYSFAKLRHVPAPDLLQLLLDASMRHMALTAAPPPSPSPSAAVSSSSSGESKQSGSGSAGVTMMSPQDLSNAVWALSSLGVRPGAAWLGCFWSAFCRRMSAFNTKDLAQATYSLAKLGWHAGEAGAWLMLPPGRDAAFPLAPPMVSLVPTDRAATARGSTRSPLSTTHAPLSAAGASGSVQLAALPRVPPSSPLSSPLVALPPGVSMLLAESAAALPRCSSQDLANLTWGIAQMGLRPPQGWCLLLAEALIRRGDQLQGSHLSTTVWALGKMGFKPKPRSLIQVGGWLGG